MIRTPKLVHAAATVVASAFLLTAATAFADTSLAIQSLSPSATVAVGTQVTFTAVPTGLNANTTFSISDSFSGGTIVNNTINGLGSLYWTPTTADIGTHVLTISASDNTGANANATQTITVTGTPTVTLSNILPATNPAVGATVTFDIVPTNFPGTSYTYTMSDTHPDTTMTSANISSSGHVSWKPTSNEQGLHTITFTVSAGGSSASKTQAFNVGGANAVSSSSSGSTSSTGKSLSISYVRPSVGISVGVNATAGVTASGFTPTGYTVLDNFTGGTTGAVSTVKYANVDATGAFSWTPTTADIGTHILTFTGTDASGASATTQTTFIVLTTPATTQTTTATTPVTTPVVTTPVVTPVASSYYFTSALSAGSTGAEVTALQNLLAKLGFLSATPTGTYGPATTAAVKAYQSARGLSALGNVGPGTRAALNAESGTTVSTPAASVTTTTSVGMSAATKLVLVQIAQQLQQLAAQLAALAQ